MLTPIVWNQLSKLEQAKLLQRPIRQDQDNLREQVQKIINAVRDQGDAACQAMTKQFDGVSLKQFMVSEQELAAATRKINQQTKNAILRVIAQLKAFHAPQILKAIKVETSKGIFCESQARAIQRRRTLYSRGQRATYLNFIDACRSSKHCAMSNNRHVHATASRW